MIPLKDDIATATRPIVTVTLITLNVLVWFWQVSGGPELERQRTFSLGAIPYNITHREDTVAVVPRTGGGRGLGFDYVPVSQTRGLTADSLTQSASPWLTLLTCMFLHGGLMHLLGNMLFLWIFGNNLEDAMGRFRFIAFYLFSGIVASLCHVVNDPASPIPTVGASGAISGILGGYLLLYPRAGVLTLIPLGFFTQIIRLPAFVFLPLWFVMQFAGLLGSGGGVAWWAHIGGFVAGLIVVRVMESREHRDRRLHSGQFVDRGRR